MRSAVASILALWMLLAAQGCGKYGPPVRQKDEPEQTRYTSPSRAGTPERAHETAARHRAEETRA